jgi:hypothetical protein
MDTYSVAIIHCVAVAIMRRVIVLAVEEKDDDHIVRVVKRKHDVLIVGDHPKTIMTATEETLGNTYDIDGGRKQMMRSFQYERRPRIFNTSSRTHLTEGATISISLSRLAPNTPPAKPLNHQLPVFLVLAYLIFMHKDPVPAERSVTARHLTSLVWPHAISSRNLRADGEYRTRGSAHHRG